jgi:hypothetical protein
MAKERLGKTIATIGGAIKPVLAISQQTVWGTGSFGRFPV